MDPALQLLPLPPSGTRIRRIEWPRRARLAPDAGVPELVQRQQRNRMRLCVVPHLLRGPPRERADLPNRLPARQRERLDLREIGPRRRLLAAESREPRVVGLQRGKERLDLVLRATGLRARLPEAWRRL